MPYFAEIFDAGTDREKYWKFLKNGYDGWMYMLIDDDAMTRCKEEYKVVDYFPRFRNSAEPSSVVLSLVLNVLGLESDFEVKASGDDFKYPALVTERLYGEIFHHEKDEVIIAPFLKVPAEMLKDPEALKKSGMLDRMILDDAGNPIEFGHIYVFNFEAGLAETDKYPALVDLWEKDDMPAKKQFRRVQHYYEVLKDKYAHVDEMDDDDF